jgi:hypothetical protein
MLGLNKPSTLYPIKMIWYPSEDNKNKGIQVFKQNGKPFFCDYAKTQDINRLNLNQGVTSTSMFLETDTFLPIQNNDKIVYNGKRFIVKNIKEDVNPLSGGMFTNKPASYIKYLEVN